jgi:hypothetical protein
MKKQLVFLVSILIIIGKSNCQVLNNENSYLGQKPPELSPLVFAPGIVSAPESLEIGCTWSPDGKEFYFVRQMQNGGQMLCSRWENSQWNAPAESEIFKKHPGFEPFISVDGKKFFYTRFALPPEMSENPENFTDQQKQDNMVNIWVMNKKDQEFSEPEFCAQGMFCSSSKNGNLYVTITTGEKLGIYRYVYNDGKYSEKEFLGGGVNSPIMGAHPCIAPDESFIVFDSKRKEDPEDTDLYVCFKKKDGTWSEAYWLGDQVNTKWNDICPSISPDGKYLFYMSKADIYWVSTDIFKELYSEKINLQQDIHKENYQILSASNNITIPFEYYRNKFRFKAHINGKECYLMLDNGSLWDELLFFGSPKVDSLNFRFTGETSIGLNKADFAENVVMQFNDIVFNKQTAIVTRYNPNLPNLWEGTEGQVSAAFFKNFIVKIDFQKMFLELIPPENFNYSGNGQVLEMKPGPFNSRLVSATVELENGNSVKLDLLVDLGGLYPLYLPLGRINEITIPENAKEITLGAGLQVQKGYLGNIKSIHLGKISENDIEAAFIPVSYDTDVYGNTMIGLPLLQKFTVFFDYFNNRLILEK